ncbi:MAG: 50S ribosomal protein L18, partial [Deltaproteobacteria bacterium]|nr:50S ribosomal protein L18 [Deltaproteobacteria bacterium]
MSTKIRRKTNPKRAVRFKRKSRIRSKVNGTLERPRFSVFRSNQHIYVQVIDDVKGHTLV